MTHIKHILLTALLFSCLSTTASAADKPNILWIFQEDTSPWLGLYGHKVNQGHTPNIDKLAKQGVLFTRAFVPHPVCSACRSAMMAGTNGIRVGTHEHRSRRNKNNPYYLPDNIKSLPELMQQAGYFTFNVGKSDYNFSTKTELYTPITNKNKANPWRQTPQGKPFFGQIQLRGGKINTTKNFPDFIKKTNPADVTVPADYPQNQLYREVVAQHYDTIRLDDMYIGKILKQLKADNLLENTIVVYFSDHGANNLVRHKQMPTEGGLHVPFIIKGPAKWVPTNTPRRTDLINTLDLSATTLAWAGIPIPAWYEGRNLFADNFKPRTFVAAAKDRLDHTIDRVRSIRTERYRYTRNYMLDRVLLQPQYRDSRPFLAHLTKAYADGTLDPKLADIYYGPRPAEELYDVIKDPAQVNNLANNPDFAETLQQHRQILNNWIAKGDLGDRPEPDEELEMNGDKHWGVGVNPEYERIRKDSDGDGLSDRWEQVNKRDPNDGKLLFTFNCGGWQTEGWQSTGNTTNIAGHQGFLNFTLLTGNATLVRNNLKLDASKNLGSLFIKTRATKPSTLTVSANGHILGKINIKPTTKSPEYQIPLNSNNWAGTITSLKLQYESQPNTIVDIDNIRTGAK